MRATRPEGANPKATNSQEPSSTPAQPPEDAGLPKPLTGKGSVPPSERDPKRVLTPKERKEQLAQQDGNCANCGNKIPGGSGKGHHTPLRHADGGKTAIGPNGGVRIVCDPCHQKLHSKVDPAN